MANPGIRRAALGLLLGPLALSVAACARRASSPAAPSADASPAEAPAPAIASYQGFASYHPYDDVPGINVACSPAASTEFDPKNFNLMVTALQDRLFDQLGKTEVCHKCAQVTSLAQAGGNGRSVTVRIIDRSQDHANNDGHRYLDLSRQAFTLIGDIGHGFIPVRFDITDCPAGLR